MAFNNSERDNSTLESKERQKKKSPLNWITCSMLQRENSESYIHEKLTRIIANKWKQHANNVSMKNNENKLTKYNGSYK